MLCKYVLTVAGVVYELPKSCIQNWDEIQCTLKREDLGGVIRTFTSKFVFVGLAYDLLLNEWIDKYLLSDASIEIYEINNLHTYDIIINCKLDFGTFDDSNNTISMNSVDDSTAKTIKANKSTQYEYLVDDIHDFTPLYYDRINMQNLFNFTCGDQYVVNPIELAKVYISSYSNEICRGGYLEYDTGEQGVVANLLDVPTSGINVNIDIDVEYENSGEGQYATFTIASCGNVQRETINKGESKNIKLSIHVSKASFDSYEQKKRVFFNLEMKASHTTYAKINITKFNEFKITYNSIGDLIYIDVVRPSILLNSLLKSMNGGKEGLTGSIDYDGNSRLIACAIVAAESIRGIPNAKIYTSYTKFVEWMEAVFGYVPVIDGKTIRFVHRDKLFVMDVCKELGYDYTEFTYSVDEKMIYSSIRVGYDKQDYDSINGRDEFRFTTEFTTGIDITDNTLELISPYRSDVYGIEFLAQKRGKNTTDNESDNDVFFVGAMRSQHTDIVNGIPILVLENWKLIRDDNWKISGVLTPESMFNVMYNQRSMILANEKYIGISANRLDFASSDGNSDVIINSVKLSDPIIITDRLATCGKINLSTFDEKLPSSVKGIITLEKDGFLYQGYMTETNYKIEKPDGVKYEFIVKSISHL